MIYIPKTVLKKLKLRKEEDIKTEEKAAEELQAVENTKRFVKSLEAVDEIGKSIGEMREWEPYCSDNKTYMPFGLNILDCNKQQLLQLLSHCYGTALHLKNKLDKIKIK